MLSIRLSAGASAGTQMSTSPSNSTTTANTSFPYSSTTLPSRPRTTTSSRPLTTTRAASTPTPSLARSPPSRASANDSPQSQLTKVRSKGTSILNRSQSTPPAPTKRKDSTSSIPTTRIPTDTCFIPSPKITFLVDDVEELTCQICCTTPMSLNDKKFAIRDCDPAMLPCGHVYGHSCLRRWLKSHNACPHCRMKLSYPDCGHKMEPRVLDRESIMNMPRTIPEGGRVKPRCPNCRMTQLERYEDETFMYLKKEFKKARDRYERENTKEAAAAMKSAKRMLEDAPRTSKQEKKRIVYSDW